MGLTRSGWTPSERPGWTKTEPTPARASPERSPEASGRSWRRPEGKPQAADEPGDPKKSRPSLWIWESRSAAVLLTWRSSTQPLHEQMHVGCTTTSANGVSVGFEQDSDNDSKNTTFGRPLFGGFHVVHR